MIDINEIYRMSMYNQAMNKHFNDWWEKSIGYMIYPISYQDSNSDGYGDIRGIISRLDYLKELGINLLYICPLFETPFHDGGYDVSNYYRIDPAFGNMEDLKELIKEAHAREIRLIMDLPLNHTSKEHPWFQKALTDPSSKERGFYYFLEGKEENGKLLPPNNWGSFLGGSAWERVGDTSTFYLHIFGKEQPDVRWDNPEVRKEMIQIACFYRDLGVDGFRLDACSHLAKDLSFENSSLPESNGVALDFSKFSNRPELLSYLKEFSDAVKGDSDLLLIGESGGCIQPEEALPLVNKNDGPLDMLFNFDTVNENGSYESFAKTDEEIKTDVISLKRNFMRWYNTLHEDAYLPIYWENHDNPRLLNQYGSTKYRDESAKMLLVTSLFLYGTPFMQYGDEIGMSNLHFEHIEDFYLDEPTKSEVASWRKEGIHDEQILRYLNRSSRLSSRSIMQWENKEYAGFSDTKPYFPLNPNYKEGVNILSEMENPYSILNFYQYAIAYRRNALVNQTVLHSPLKIIDPNHPDVFSYLHNGALKLLVISNMRDYEVYFSFYFDILDIKLHNYGDVILENHVFHLRPFETYLLIVK